jgi:hypothetical protein
VFLPHYLPYLIFLPFFLAAAFAIAIPFGVYEYFFPFTLGIIFFSLLILHVVAYLLADQDAFSVKFVNAFGWL